MHPIIHPSGQLLAGAAPRYGAPAGDEQLDPIAAAARLFAESLDLPVVLERVAQRVALLCEGVCQVRFAPAHRRADAQRRVAGPDGELIHDEAGAAGEPYAALLARLRTHEVACAVGEPLGVSRPEGEIGAALLIVPLIARGRRIGALDVVVPADSDGALGRDQRLLRQLAAHAALAIDTADTVAQLRAAAGGGAHGSPRRDPGPLLALVAHDLRGPLATLSSSVQLLVRTLKGAGELERGKLSRLAELAEAAIAQLEAQVGALSPGRQSGATSASAAAQPTDLVRLARLMANFYQQTTGRHQLVVCADVPELSGPWARPHIERILGNLLVNGIKYSPGGGEVRVTVAREDDATGSWASLYVENYGIGIPPQDLPRLAQPGYRARNVGAIPGTGFGLASVREVVEQYGGSFAIQSAVGAATTVAVRLPLALRGAQHA